MFADPTTHWWSIMALRLITALLAGIAFIAVADIAAGPDTSPSAASPVSTASSQSLDATAR